MIGFLINQAAAAQRFREQQELARRQRLDEIRSKDIERRNQVEERKKIIQQAEQQRREAVLRKGAVRTILYYYSFTNIYIYFTLLFLQEREQRLELKRRQERSNVVFAFGSSTPRMLDPKEQGYWGSRRYCIFLIKYSL